MTLEFLEFPFSLHQLRHVAGDVKAGSLVAGVRDKPQGLRAHAEAHPAGTGDSEAEALSDAGLRC